MPATCCWTTRAGSRWPTRPDENAITNALRKVLKKERLKVYFVAGHGERDLDDPKPGGFQVAKTALANEGYEIESLNLVSRGTVPQDAAVVIVAGPEKAALVHRGAGPEGLPGEGRPALHHAGGL